MWAKRGQGVFGMSFGAIFSILIIIAILGVAFIAVRHFLGLNECAQIGLEFEDLQEEIDKAWTSGKYKDSYEISFPAGILSSGVTHVCFGDVDSLDVSGGDRERAEEIQINGQYSQTANVFLYPPEEACDGSLSSKTLKHIEDINGFFCMELDGGKAMVDLSKESDSALVVLEN